MGPTAPILYIPKGKLGNIGGTFLSVEIEWEWKFYNQVVFIPRKMDYKK